MAIPDDGRGWKPPHGHRNNLKSARHRLDEQPVVSESLKGEACNKTLRKFPAVSDVEKREPGFGAHGRDRDFRGLMLDRIKGRSGTNAI